MEEIQITLLKYVLKKIFQYLSYLKFQNLQVRGRLRFFLQRKIQFLELLQLQIPLKKTLHRLFLN